MNLKATYILSLLLFASAFHLHAQQGLKILFDASKAETAGNADWVVDAEARVLGYPSPSGAATFGAGNESLAQPLPYLLQSGITASTPESYWDGALSYWGIDCVKKNFTVETLPYNGAITYGDLSNSQDLSTYKVFIVCEPNILFTAAEKVALLSFVQNGGGLFMISDHDGSDRNGDGWDSPAIWNDFMTNNTVKVNPFGISFNLLSVSPTSSNVSTSATDSLLHGPMGNVTRVVWSSGTTMTLIPAANSSVTPVICTSGIFGNNNVMVATTRYGNGKVVAIGDSSPCDDGTGDPNDMLYDGYITDAGGNHQRLLMNATIWLAAMGSPLPLIISDFDATLAGSSTKIVWKCVSETGVREYNIQAADNATDFITIKIVTPKNNNSGVNAYSYSYTAGAVNKSIYYRLKIVSTDGSVSYSTIKKVSVLKASFNAILVTNPVSDAAYIGVTSSKASVILVSVYNAAGKRQFQKSFNCSNGAQVIRLPLKNIGKGMYYIKLHTPNDEIILPFVKG